MRAFTKFPTSVGSEAKPDPEHRKIPNEIPKMMCVSIVVMMSPQNVNRPVYKSINPSEF